VYSKFKYKYLKTQSLTSSW